MSSPRYKDASMIGKLSSVKLQLDEAPRFADKQVSALVPAIRFRTPQKLVKPANKSKRGLLPIKHSLQGMQMPLPNVPFSQYKIRELKKICAKNPQMRNPQQQVFYVDGSHGKISQERGLQVDSDRQKLTGFLYNKSRSLLHAGQIRHQQIDKTHTNIRGISKTSHNFKNFMNNQYVKRVGKRQRPRITIIDYNQKLAQSVHHSQIIQKRLSKKRPQSPIEQYRMFQQHQNVQRCAVEYQKNYSKIAEKYQNQLIPVDSQQFIEQEPVCHVLSRVGSCVFLKEQQGSGFVQQKNIQDQEESTALLFMESEDVIDTELSHEPSPSFYLQSDDQGLINIDFQDRIATIRTLLIEHQQKLRVSFLIPQQLMKVLSPTVTQPQIHYNSHKIFQTYFGVKPQLLSIKRFSNCILITTKNHNILNKVDKLAILWYFSGRFYVGGWNCPVNSSSEGHKQGIGIQFYPSSFVYYGSFVSNRRQGYGLMKKAKGEVYLGLWQQGHRHGWGKLFNRNGHLTYDGSFVQGKFKSPRKRTNND